MNAWCVGYTQLITVCVCVCVRVYCDVPITMLCVNNSYFIFYPYALL